MQYITYPEITYLITGNLYPLTPSPILPTTPHRPPHPGNYQSTTLLLSLFFKVPHVSEIIQYLSFSV